MLHHVAVDNPCMAISSEPVTAFLDGLTVTVVELGDELLVLLEVAGAVCLSAVHHCDNEQAGRSCARTRTCVQTSRRVFASAC